MSIIAVGVSLIAAAVLERTPHGIRVEVDNGYMEVAVTSAGFRIGLSSDKNTVACNTTMLEPNMKYPDFQVINQTIISEGGRVSIQGNGFSLMDTKSQYIVSGTVSLDSDSVGISLVNNPNSLYFGSGSGLDDGGMLSATSSYTYVWNEKVYVPHYWSNSGYSALGVVPEWRNFNPGNSYPVHWGTDSQSVNWQFSSTQKADMYLMPAKTMDEGSQQYWTLIGSPLVIPRYAFGFLACRWGWQDRQYIESTLNTFRNESWPIDGWISDFGWFTDVNDYDFPPTGSPTYQDFGYNNATFPQPVQQLKTYREDLNLRFAGIRKPRLGNTALLQMAKSKGWLDSQGTGDNLRNLNFTKPEVRDWYSQINSHYLPDGVNFWWNDEAEYEYFAFYNWNTAQVAELSAYDSNRRFFSLNRAFTPGMQRLGATVWTGDQQSTWDNLRLHPGYLLKWQQAGIGFIACDTGGFSASNDVELLVRWYQVSAFMSIMRVHSTKAVTPHFPFLYGPDAAAAFRFTMNLRYKFIPMIYSLAHKQHDDKIPIFRALMAEWPTDPAVGTNFPWQWLVGSHLMVAPILEQGGWGQVHMPKLESGVWYQFNTSTVITVDVVPFGPNTPWETIPMYARSGAIIPLAPLVLYTDLLPGGPLEVQVYAGCNGSFTFVEDDGETYDYLKNIKKTTTFTYNDNTKTLSWNSEGTFTGPNLFTQIKMTFFQSSGRSESAVVSFGKSGSLKA
eukprot:TRINITY_DN118_c3_g1_i1.p1 TRINITY_DN118_c3_g1~~TRINITY_DN118_c3_g1_i1.p1  ORF type:complete len:728 (+),score=134.34 TRINITY_DN118_c3_g1_i1:55-2238(+)